MDREKAHTITMIFNFLSKQILNTQASSILKGLFFQRLLIIVISTLVIIFQYTSKASYFVDEPGFALSLSAGAIYTLLSFTRLKQRPVITDNELFVTTILDSILLIVLISFSGGSSNPFISYLLVLIAVSAVLFQGLRIWLFCLFSILSYTVLFYFDFFTHKSHAMNGFQLHLLGMWINFVASAGLIAFFVSSLSSALRERQIQLAEAREANLRNEQLIGIGTLAASTVHALRTPLSTMAVLLSDLKSEQAYPELNNDFELLLQQIERCKQTTNKLAALADKPEEQNAYESAEALFSYLKVHYQVTHSRVQMEFSIDYDGFSKEEGKKISQHILLRQALLNLIDNALQAAKSRVGVNFHIKEDVLVIDILDDGPGIPAEILENWGKPFFSGREAGLGIGIFLANSTIERFKGRIELNHDKPHKDYTTQVSIVLPLQLSP